MKDFQNIGRGLELATSTLVLGFALAVSSNIPSAPAAVIGIFNSSGTALISNLTVASPLTDVISFTAPFTTNSASGIFNGLSISSISKINVDSPTVLGTIPGIGTLTTYTAKASDSQFITFNDGSSFVVENPFAALRTFNSAALGGNNVGYSFDMAGNVFNASGSFIRSGILTANEINNPDLERGSFFLTLTGICCTPIPEPTSTGALAILGLGALAFSQKVVLRRKSEK
ncbi:PEP-CTERM sorting domain-containing protein [Anabaena subtropica]|uniref:PEP-CTERM sorting domain-containing protein n=1 Tax=Anabaena subtropica FACHB-260 TaxID=2692884 RepID=A0ABR8CVG3_9NOST|nr:PEP-CTERM sorting domain-containing protein [Anabaena subtropica]MBD2346513.1 PEP-CTERM sorting domain-containing protein [Anabaena subtropica FACHB-260]